MTNDEVLSIVRRYAGQLEHDGAVPDRMDPGTPFKSAALTTEVLENHVLWLCRNMETLIADGKSEGKIGRHLGWIQCGMWVLGASTVESAKKDNMPEGEVFDRNH
jgi:hypothetical protein